MPDRWIRRGTLSRTGARDRPKVDREKLTIRGNAAGTTRMEARHFRKILLRYDVEVRQRRDVSLVFHFVREKSGKRKTSRSPEEIKLLLNELNNHFVIRIGVGFKLAGLHDFSIDDRFFEGKSDLIRLTQAFNLLLTTESRKNVKAVHVFLVPEVQEEILSLKDLEGKAESIGSGNWVVLEDTIGSIRRRREPRNSALVLAHEIGHLFGAEHVARSGPDAKLMEKSSRYGSGPGVFVGRRNSKIVYDGSRRFLSTS